MRSRFIVWALALGVCVVVSVSEVVIGDDRGGNNFQLRLNGFQENPSVSTTGRGRLDLRIDEDAEEMSYRLRYSMLEGTTQANGSPGTVLFAHIHLGATHTNGGVVAFLCGGGRQAGVSDTGRGRRGDHCACRHRRARSSGHHRRGRNRVRGIRQGDQGGVYLRQRPHHTVAWRRDPGDQVGDRHEHDDHD